MTDLIPRADALEELKRALKMSIETQRNVVQKLKWQVTDMPADAVAIGLKMGAAEQVLAQWEWALHNADKVSDVESTLLSHTTKMLEYILVGFAGYMPMALAQECRLRIGRANHFLDAKKEKGGADKINN